MSEQKNETKVEFTFGYIKDKKGKKRIVNFLSYPGNYGFIPQTVGGDEDPIDVIDLETAVNRGQVVSRKIIGGMYFEDKKEVDVKLIAIDPNDIFSKYDSIEDLMLDRPAVIEIIKKWFDISKGDNIDTKDDFFKFVAVWLAFNALFIMVGINFSLC